MVECLFLVLLLLLWREKERDKARERRIFCGRLGGDGKTSNRKNSGKLLARFIFLFFGGRNTDGLHTNPPFITFFDAYKVNGEVGWGWDGEKNFI